MNRIAVLCFLAVLTLSNAELAHAESAKTYFEVAREDVAKAVAAALSERGAAEKTEAIVYSKEPTLYKANAPLKVAIQALTFDKDSKKWQANMHIISNEKTISVMPIQGRYSSVIAVPTLTRKTASTDIITDADIEMTDVPERLVRKDTVREVSDILGKSPKRSISPNRPIRLTEVNLPVIVKKGASVEIQYSAPFMNIRTVGKALEDGSLGSMIRVQNTDSDRAIGARVISAGIVETNSKKTTVIN
jgi:flagellar basal body P-ring formation protein FlgA